MNRAITDCCAAVLMLTVIAGLAPFSYALAEQEQRIACQYEISLAKGIFQIETGDYGEAISNLNCALGFKPGDKVAIQSLGIAYSRSGEFPRAKQVLQMALDIDKTDVRTRYELGVASLKLGERDSARQFFSEVAAEGADDQLTTAAKRYLDLLESEWTPERAGAFTLDVLAGLQYDSNVILEPSNPVPSGEKETDWRVITAVNAAYPFIYRESLTADAGYTYYQSLHHSLHDFNVQQHNASVGGKFPIAEDVQASMRYRFSYSLVGDDHYSTIHQITPTLSLKFSPAQSGELYYVREFKRFHDSADFPQNSDRGGSNNAFGITYRLVLHRNIGFTLGYAYDRDSTSAPWWAYTGQKVTVGLNMEFAGTGVFAGLSSSDQRFRERFPGFADNRHDRVQEYSLTVVREITGQLHIAVSELLVENRSNLGLYDYTRNIAGLFAVITL